MAATIRPRITGKLDKFGNAVVSYQVRWRDPVRDEFGAPTGQFKQTSETFVTERKAKAHLRKVEDQLDSARGVDPSSAKAKANKPLGEYARQYLDSLVGTVDSGTIDGYANIYRRHIGPVFGSKASRGHHHRRRSAVSGAAAGTASSAKLCHSGCAASIKPQGQGCADGSAFTQNGQAHRWHAEAHSRCGRR
jgi:hypothetical protein